MSKFEVTEKAELLAKMVMHMVQDWAEEKLTDENLTDCLTVAFRGCMVPLSPRLKEAGWRLLDEVRPPVNREEMAKAAEAFKDVFPTEDMPPEKWAPCGKRE